MEQVKEAPDYYKHISSPLLSTRESYTEAANLDIAAGEVARSKLLDDVEGLVRHYFKSSGLSDGSRINHLTQHVLLHAQSVLVTNHKADLMQEAIQQAQKLLALDYTGIYTSNVTPAELPVTMRVQELAIGSGCLRKYLMSLFTALKSIHAVMSRQRN